MTDTVSKYYRLERVDGLALPIELEYGDARCVVTDGDLVLRNDDTFDGDGTICIRLFGTAFGGARIDQIFLEREAFDRLDAMHLTFPGGCRHRQNIPPHSVVRSFGDGLEVATLASDPTTKESGRIFGPHRWSFVASERQLPGSDLAVDRWNS